MKRVETASDYLGMTYAEKVAIMPQYLPDDVQQEFDDNFRAAIPHPAPANQI